MKTRLADTLCGIYSLLLYAYPREFRLEYGVEMKRLFRDRCNDAVRANELWRLLRFAVQSAMDWMATTMRERADSVRTIVPGAGKPAARGFVAEWAVTILIYLFATTTLVQAYVIPTGSMEGSLRVGDHVIVDRMAYADPGAFGRYFLPYRDIQRGDIVTFHFPEDTRQTFVKRVIGLPGDRIRLMGKQVVRNGHRLIERYTQHIDSGVDIYRDDFPAAADFRTTPRGRDMFEHHMVNGEIVVPPKSLFVLGDNRDNSEDSRYWGFVPREYVTGKPLFVYWSYDAPTGDLERWSISHIGDVAEHFFTKTRWDRTFLVPKSLQAEEQVESRVEERDAR
jgi:signal peptidase I